MAKLYFYYSTMNAGKTTTLLQSAYNYQERGMRTLVFTPALDTRSASRNSRLARQWVNQSSTRTPAGRQMGAASTA